MSNTISPLLTQDELNSAATGKGHGWSPIERDLAKQVITLERALDSARFAIQVCLEQGLVSERNVRSTLNQIDVALGPKKNRKDHR